MHRLMKHSLTLTILVSIIGISCNEKFEEPVNPLFDTWVFHSFTYTDCDNGSDSEPSIYPCDESSCLQVTFEDSKYYVMDVKYDTYHQKKVSKIIVNANEEIFTCPDEYGGYLGVCDGGGTITKYNINGDTLTLKYGIEYENCIRLTILIKKN